MSLPEESLGFLLADVSRLMRRAFQEYLEGEGTLTLAQARALIYVSRHQGIRQVELADLLEVQPITLARLLDQLAQHGLIERRPDPHDRRAHLIYLTDAAAPQLASIKERGAANRAAALRGVSKEQAATLTLVLKQIRDNLTAH
ncbi:MAG TPA: MarR family transcriptional regulator [Gammaproteobacteria bacterium]